MHYRESLNGLVAAILSAALLACSEPVSPPVVSTGPEAPAASMSGVTISNVTTGGAFDPDGLWISIDGNSAYRFDLNETMTFHGIADGSHTVVLSGLASNCRTLDGDRKSVSVDQGAVAQLRFDVVCTPPAELASIRIVFSRAIGRTVYTRSGSLVAMNADGSGRVQLTSGAFHDYGPDLSPDGRTIAFTRGNPAGRALSPDIYLRRSDGSEVLLLHGPVYDPDWSPDGTRIAFSGLGNHWGGPIMVARSDGSGVTRLTGDDLDLEEAWPAWSPDGRRLAFTRAHLVPTGAGGPSNGIWLMNADGSGSTHLTRDAGWSVWSPDGGMIAFRDDKTSSIDVMNVNGSGRKTVLRGGGLVHDWSADGRFLLLSAPGSSRSDIFLLEVATGATVRLTADGAHNTDAIFWMEPIER